jgi:hypothetical protein
VQHAAGTELAVEARGEETIEIRSSSQGLTLDSIHSSFSISQPPMQQSPPPPCDECEAAPAALRCQDCELVYCQPCGERFHKKGTRAKHVMGPLPHHHHHHHHQQQQQSLVDLPQLKRTSSSMGGSGVGLPRRGSSVSISSSQHEAAFDENADPLISAALGRRRSAGGGGGARGLGGLGPPIRHTTPLSQQKRRASGQYVLGGPPSSIGKDLMGEGALPAAAASTSTTVLSAITNEDGGVGGGAGAGFRPRALGSSMGLSVDKQPHVSAAVAPPPPGKTKWVRACVFGRPVID